MTNKTYMNIAKEIAKNSKCVSHQVGCVIVKDGRVISTGYNGTVQGDVNCSEVFKDYDSARDREEHKMFSDNNELHSEQNAIIWAARTTGNVEGASIYCTHQPCFQCLKMIVAAGINKIYYEKSYDRIQLDEKLRDEWNDYWKRNGVKVIHMEK